MWFPCCPGSKFALSCYSTQSVRPANLWMGRFWNLRVQQLAVDRCRRPVRHAVSTEGHVVEILTLRSRTAIDKHGHANHCTDTPDVLVSIGSPFLPAVTTCTFSMLSTDGAPGCPPRSTTWARMYSLVQDACQTTATSGAVLVPKWEVRALILRLAIGQEGRGGAWLPKSPQ